MTWKKRNIIIITMNFLALLLYMTTMLQRENPIGQTLTVILLAASGSFILLACVPLVYYLFSCLLYTNIHVPQLSEIPFRAISKYYYLVHPLMILFVHAWFPQVDSFWMAVAKVVCVLCFTHICTLLLIHIKKRYPAVPL